jgi:ribosomal protein S18 acetylase RimI-like enzyme
MQLRTIKIDDFQKLTEFWKENYFVSGMDSSEHFFLFLEKNPDLSVLIEENGEIIGTALGSYDGRRGYLQKLVTKKKFRNKGIGMQLINEVVKRLKEAGAFYIPISVEEGLIPFYEKCGFVKKDSISMSMDL